MAKAKLVGRNRKYIREEKAEKIFREMTEHHVDVLENIEFAIIKVWRENERIDDHAVVAALKAVIEGTTPDSEESRLLVKAIENARRLRRDVSDEIWVKGLKVVLGSVYTHSEAGQGDVFYLEFADMFIP